MSEMVFERYELAMMISTCSSSSSCGVVNLLVARVISFEAFSMMVDEALERMKKMLESNKAMQTLVSGEAGEVNE